MRQATYRSKQYACIALLVGISACNSTSRTASQSTNDQPQHEPIAIELRLAQDSAAPDYFAALIPGTSDSIYVSDEDGLSMAQIDSVSPQVGEQGVALNVWLNPEGRERIAQMTENNIGSRLAVLVDTKIVNAPTIVQKLDISDKPVTIMIPASKDSAPALASRLKYPQ